MELREREEDVKPHRGRVLFSHSQVSHLSRVFQGCGFSMVRTVRSPES